MAGNSVICTMCSYTFTVLPDISPCMANHYVNTLLLSRDNAVLALWGCHAERFDAQPLMEKSRDTPVVLLFVGVTSNTFDGTRLYRNIICCLFSPRN